VSFFTDSQFVKSVTKVKRSKNASQQKLDTEQEFSTCDELSLDSDLSSTKKLKRRALNREQCRSPHKLRRRGTRTKLF